MGLMEYRRFSEICSDIPVPLFGSLKKFPLTTDFHTCSDVRDSSSGKTVTALKKHRRYVRIECKRFFERILFNPPIQLRALVATIEALLTMKG
jgi:hypothetical protein